MRTARSSPPNIALPRRFRLLLIAIAVGFQAIVFWRMEAGRDSSASGPERFARSAAGLGYLRGIYHEVVDLVEDDRGDVWVATREEVRRYPQGDPERGETVIGRRLLAERERARWEAPASLSRGHGGTVYVGGWRGSLRAVRRDGEVEIAPSEAPFGSRIHRVTEIGDELWVATNQGLYVGRSDGGGFTRVWRTDSAVELLARPGERPLVGISSGVVGGAADALRPLWRTRDPRRSVRSLARSGESLWVGTMSGLLRFDLAPFAAGQLAHAAPRADLEGLEISALAAAADGGLWVGLPGPNGLRLRTPDGTWRALGRKEGLPDGNVNALVIDRRGRLWVSIYPVGALVGDEAKARARSR